MVIIDTGVWLALANPKDNHHSRALQSLARINEPLITTWPVITETCYLLLTRLGNIAQSKFLKNLGLGTFEIFDL
ncbi:type II toxin-antitoxin system VapC family toxin [Leptolyngbya ectocarpi]|uniref:type II toxin-antitoxin system VapC family toxin n=1 Tax=Leptolyngbya ectocarpi TaxID=1202 RepID=UPI001D15C9BE|nr:PIN domain-containing protein [Leptolyngbya ectocarpi]